ncbi:MAG: hypothetical protein QG596_125 [Actinomycetota bacterium]|jgi:hypothetical protein|nr:hypothetical protein [Actinomycetota bacterium]
MKPNPATRTPKEPRRLPFRLKVPERDELIAYALATLAMGLMIGLAIGPIVNGAAKVTPIIIAPLPGAEEETEVTGTVADVPALQSPAGSDSGENGNSNSSEETLVASEDPVGEVTIPDADESPPPTDPKSEYREPKDEDPAPDPSPDPDPEPEPEGVELTGTVLANSPGSKTYWVSSDGELTTVFAATVPDPGLVISTRVEPLSNGTLTEVEARSAMDISKESSVKSVLSYVDPAAGVAVLSSRGSSLPVMQTEPGLLDPFTVGQKVEATINLDVPDPENFNANDPAAEPLDLPIQLEEMRPLTGSPPVELTGELISVDEVAFTLTMAADSTGSLGSVIELLASEDFPFGSVTPGQSYSATATRVDGRLKIIGFSPASGKAAANDPARAFGTHAR